MKQKRNMSTVHWANFVSLSGIEYTYQLLQNMQSYSNAIDRDKHDAITILSYAIDDDLCRATADLFFKFYARFTYNFVWTILPFGGIYLVGETATVHQKMLSDIFLPEYFNCVSSKQPVLKRIPIYIINNDVQLILYGTMHYFWYNKLNNYRMPS
ncbi:MAG TPA: glucokinase [Candidatus Babeliales bacterium]|nr:glucokinase [Candidatus Babeliales bacterium]